MTHTDVSGGTGSSGHRATPGKGRSAEAVGTTAIRNTHLQSVGITHWGVTLCFVLLYSLLLSPVPTASLASVFQKPELEVIILQGRESQGPLSTMRQQRFPKTGKGAEISSVSGGGWGGGTFNLWRPDPGIAVAGMSSKRGTHRKDNEPQLERCPEDPSQMGVYHFVGCPKEEGSPHLNNN